MRRKGNDIMKQVTIINEVKLNANGISDSKVSKRTCCIDEQGHITWFLSQSDAAREAGVAQPNLSYAMNHDKRCKGNRYFFANEPHKIIDYIAEKTSNLDELRAKAAAYDAIIAEQEAARKAKEEHEKAIADASAELIRRREIVARLEDELRRAQERVAETENKLNELGALEM